MQKLKKFAGFQAPSNETVLETVWSGLVDQLEERSVLTREERAETIRRLAWGARRKHPAAVRMIN